MKISSYFWKRLKKNDKALFHFLGNTINIGEIKENVDVIKGWLRQSNTVVRGYLNLPANIPQKYRNLSLAALNLISPEYQVGSNRGYLKTKTFLQREAEGTLILDPEIKEFFQKETIELYQLYFPFMKCGQWNV